MDRDFFFRLNMEKSSESKRLPREEYGLYRIKENVMRRKEEVEKEKTSKTNVAKKKRNNGNLREYRDCAVHKNLKYLDLERTN